MAQMKNIHTSTKKFLGESQVLLLLFFLSLSLLLSFLSEQYLGDRKQQRQMTLAFERSVKPLPPVGEGCKEVSMFLAHPPAEALTSGSWRRDSRGAGEARTNTGSVQAIT